ncbi:hypothetical protein [Streptosporangium sp. NPDC000396]|uniref:hypothetical protein n=1 Tax=Streptosporangium sp. NPDC000396 TaxID=3366185 RepID=UPI0036C93687
MGHDGGVNLSHQAVINAEKDLKEVLTLLNPGWEKGNDTPLFPETGPVRQLSSTPEAFGGAWPSTQGFQASFRGAERAISGNCTAITKQLESAIGLLRMALTNFETAHQKGAEQAGQLQV